MNHKHNMQFHLIM